MQIDEVIKNILDTGHVTTGALAILVIYALYKLWHKYETHLKEAVDKNEEEQKKALQEIRSAIIISNKNIESITEMLDENTHRMNALEAETNCIKSDSKSVTEDIAYVIREIESVKNILDSLRYTLFLNKKE